MRRVTGNRREQARFAQLPRETVLDRRRGIELQRMHLAAVVDEVQVSRPVETEADGLQPSGGQLLLPDNLIVLQAQAPNLAGGEVPVNVGPVQVLETPAIELAAGDGARLGMRVLDERRHDRSGAKLAIGVKGL